jgi:hypothetical protein
MSHTMLPSEVASYFATHEDKSKTRAAEFQKALDAAGVDPKALETLNLLVETQLKIEDFIIRFREAEHAKISLWASRFIPLAAAIAGVLVTLIVKHFTR